MRSQTDFHYLFSLSSPHLPTLNAQLDENDLPGLSGYYAASDFRINLRNYPKPWRSFVGVRIGRWLEGKQPEYIQENGGRARTTWNSAGIHVGWNRLLVRDARIQPFIGSMFGLDHHWMRAFTGLPVSGSAPGQTFSGDLNEERFQTWKFQGTLSLGVEINLFNNTWLNLGGGYRIDFTPNSNWRYFNQVEIPFPRSSFQSWMAEAGICLRIDPDKEVRTRQTNSGKLKKLLPKRLRRTAITEKPTHL